MFFLVFFTSLAALGRPNSCILTKITVRRAQQTVNPLSGPPQRHRRNYSINNNNNNKHDNVYGAVIMAEPLREFTRFI